MLKIGWSEKDVSITAPVCIPGLTYSKISEGTQDPILLSCLVVDNGTDCAIFLSGDFVTSANIIDEIREEIVVKRQDIPAEKIIFHITHTHCGPSFQKEEPVLQVPLKNMTLTLPEVYRTFLIEQALEAITEAFDGRTEGSISYGYGYAVVGHSRRATYLDDISLRSNVNNSTGKSQHINGHAKMYGDTADDMFAGYEGGADHFINLMYTFNKNGTLTGAIINVPCPSQNSERESFLTADYWYEVRTILRKKYGNIGILPQCAAAGDTTPRTLHYKTAQERRFALKYEGYHIDQSFSRPTEKYNRLDIAMRICETFEEVLSWAKKEMISDAIVQHIVKTIHLDKRFVSEEEYKFAMQELINIESMPFSQSGNIHEDFYNNTSRAWKVHRFRQVISRYEQQQHIHTAPMELHVIRIGDIAFASNAFELYQDFQHRIQARSPFIQTFIIQLCGQPDGYPAGYLATDQAVKNRGYSASLYCNEISPEGGQTLVEETVTELKKLY